MVPRPVANRAYELWWPAIANNGMKDRWADDNVAGTEQDIDWWIDQTRPPFVA